MPHPCVFCGLVRPRSKEHVVPQWFEDLKPPELLVRTEGEHVNVRRWVTTGKRAGIVARARGPCAPCNNGWMSQIEKTAKPHLLPMIAGREVVLTAAAQSTLATWAVLKAMTFEFTSASTRTPFFSQLEREAFRGTRVPPSPVHVYLAGYVGPHALWARGTPSTIELSSGPVVAYSSTASFGAVVFQVFSHRSMQPVHSVRLRDAFVNADIRIWPPEVPSVCWPPEYVLDQAALASYAARWATPPVEA